VTRGETFYVGVDGGASKTLAVIVDAEGRERGQGTAGRANHAVVGLEPAIEQVHQAVVDAARMAGTALPLRAAWIGLAGLDRPADHVALLPGLRAIAQDIELVNDAELILSALDGGVGVAIISGTGSNTVGWDAGGRVTRAGGWGHVMGDEGSGYDIGRACLKAAARASDGRGPATALLDLIMREWRLDDPSAMFGRVYPEDKVVVARLSTLAFAAARGGDVVARGIVERAADELAVAALAAGAPLHFPHELPLALGGGVLTHEEDYRVAVLDRIRRGRDLGQVAVVARPAENAARAARRLAAQAEEPRPGSRGASEGSTR